MALIKSTVLAQISGSINGMVFSHNSGGAYARNRSLPSNPGTDRQDQVRTSLTAISQAWANALTQDQRDQWNAYGATLTVINRIGDPIKLSGIAAFQRVNLFRMATLNEAMTLDVPDPVGGEDPIPAFVSAQVLGAAGHETRILTTSDLTGFGMVAYFSAPLSPGIKFFRGPYVGKSTGSIDLVNNAQMNFDSFASYSSGQSVAMKLILFRPTNSTKIWEVYCDPMIIPAP